MYHENNTELTSHAIAAMMLPTLSLDLSIGPRMIGLGQPMFDPVLTTGAVEGVAAEPGGRP
jgi:hypothetical protein